MRREEAPQEGREEEPEIPGRRGTAAQEEVGGDLRARRCRRETPKTLARRVLDEATTRRLLRTRQYYYFTTSHNFLMDLHGFTEVVIHTVW